MSTNNQTQNESPEEIELRMKAISEALAEMQAQGINNQSTASMSMQALIDPQDDLACEGCQ